MIDSLWGISTAYTDHTFSIATKVYEAQSVGAVEYANYISAQEWDNLLNDCLNCILY